MRGCESLSREPVKPERSERPHNARDETAMSGNVVRFVQDHDAGLASCLNDRLDRVTALGPFKIGTQHGGVWRALIEAQRRLLVTEEGGVLAQRPFGINVAGLNFGFQFQIKRKVAALAVKSLFGCERLLRASRGGNRQPGRCDCQSKSPAGPHHYLFVLNFNSATRPPG